MAHMGIHVTRSPLLYRDKAAAARPFLSKVGQRAPAVTARPLSLEGSISSVVLPPKA